MKKHLCSCLAAALALLIILPACGQAKTKTKTPADTGEASLLYADGYVYFTFGGGLYKERPDFSQQSRLVPGGAASVFYSYGRIGYVDGGSGDALTVMAPIGGGEEVLLKGAALPAATADAIYAIAGGKKNIVRIGNDGAAEELKPKNCLAFDVTEDALYYSTARGLYRLELGGKGDTRRLCGGNGITAIFAGARLREDGAAPVGPAADVYFVRNGQLYCLNTNGGVCLVGDGLKGESWRVRGEYAYCVADGQLMRQPVNGEPSDPLAGNCAAVAGAADGWVYFVSETEGARQFERMKLDGSRRREVLVRET